MLPNIAIHILFNMSISKDKQTMKFGQVMEYNMTNFFPEKSYRKCGRETVTTPFSKISKLTISLNQNQ